MPLNEARCIWAAILRVDPSSIVKGEWNAWADSTIRRLAVEALPAWVFDLSQASSHDDALLAVERQIGLEEPCVFDSEALRIGLVVARHLRGELTSEQMWATLYQISDIAEFLDGGKLKQYTSHDSKCVPDPASDLEQFAPLAMFSSRQRTHLLGAHNVDLDGKPRCFA